MFLNCSIIIGYGIDKWVLTKVQNFDSMLEGCSNFNQDISGWNITSGTSFDKTFFKCSNWSGSGSEKFILSGVTTIKDIFNGCKKFIQDLSTWQNHVNSITNFERCFNDCSEFIGTGLELWDMNSAENLKEMFNGCLKLNIDLSWNVSNVTNMSGMFNNCVNYRGNGIENFNTSRVTDMSNMFKDCILFNKNLSSWNTDNVINMNQMFKNCNLFNQDLSWNVSKVTNMSEMFKNCSSFNQDLSDWVISDLSFAYNMLDNTGISNYTFTLLLKKWGEQSNINQNVAFGCQNLKYYQWAGINGKNSNIRLINDYGWDIIGANENLNEIGFPPSISIIDSWEDIFKEGIGITTDNSFADISGYSINTIDNSNTYFGDWMPVSSIQKNIKNMFKDCINFTGNGLSEWNLSNIINMDSFLESCENFQQDLSNWDISNISTSNSIFKGCKIWDGTGSNNFNLISSNSSISLFENCENFNENLNWSDNTQTITNMDSMFKNCINFEGNGIENWNVSSVTNMSNMFNNCSSFNKDISGWDISSLLNASNMLDNCGMTPDNFSNLLNNWSSSNIINHNVN